MFRNFFRKEPTVQVDPLIDVVLENMHSEGTSSDKYPTLMGYLERLHEIKVTERQDPVSRDTIALCAANLLGILLIVAYEQKHVMTSRGFNQLIRPNRPNTP